MFDLIEKALSLSNGFCEIRISDKTSRGVAIKNGLLETSSSKRSIGAGIRVLRNGAWGFASTSDLDPDSLARALRDAEIAAMAIGSQSQKKVPALPPKKLASRDYGYKAKKDLEDIPFEEKIALAIRIESLIRKNSQFIVTATTYYSETTENKWVMTNDGAKCHSRLSKPDFYCVAVASKDGQMQSSFESRGVVGGFDELFDSRTPEQMAEKAARIAVDKLDAPYVEGGMHNVVLKPGMVGILAHEAIGHTVEADFVLSGSITAGKIGQKIASDLITMVDDGPNLMKIGNPAGYIEVDDEGVEAGGTVIIKDGILSSYLHSRETAELFGVEPTGNARAWGYTDVPIIRMRNTYIRPGKNSFDEIIGSVDKGYLLVNPENGEADANAEFMFGCGEAYEIARGKVGRLVKNVTISGQAFDVLKSVDMVGNDFEFAMGSGACGKIQPAKVDGGGPSIKCKAMLGGR